MKAAGYGVANLETNTPATTQTVYKTASLSKPVIATAVMLLVQDGKISLDDNVGKYLDDAPETWKRITVRQLLTHTSGIPRDPADYEPYKEQPISAVTQSASKLPLEFQPGEKWLYSNVGYYVLAEVITAVSGKPWSDFIHDRIFTPAHMTDARLTTTTDIVPNRASGYHYDADKITNAENWIAVRPSGAFLSTVLDLAKFEAVLNSDSLLLPASRQAMWTPAKLKDRNPTDYGFGWYIDSFLGRARIHQDGQYPGFRADYERFPDDKLTIIVLANLDNDGLERLAINIAGFYAPTLVAPKFTLTAEVPPVVKTGSSVAIRITARDEGNSAPDSLVEMEIWDAKGKTVYKQHQANMDFKPGESHTYSFSWEPSESGTYTVNVGAYAAKWVFSYGWKQKAATLEVQ